MEYKKLGNTDLIVSRLCFGSLTMSPLQRNLTPKEGGLLIEKAYEKGVNFIDTADLYNNYEHIRTGMENIGKNNLIISSKSYAYDRKTAEKTLTRALKSLKRDYIDIFMLHEQESIHTIRGHWEAIEYFMEMRDKGYIRALGLSTHHVAGVTGANKYEVFQVIHPICNFKGLGIQDGTIEDMLDALQASKKAGKGIYGMKPLGGGNLLSHIEEAFAFALDQDVMDSFAIGMQSIEEIDDNVNRFEGKISNEKILSKIKKQDRHLHIADWCRRCGKCVEACNQDALTMGPDGVEIDENLCVLCGYCSAYCPDFCIKII
jgi:aryl-alcohol dehydrogenase-like predicted oxidoreductase